MGQYIVRRMLWNVLVVSGCFSDHLRADARIPGGPFDREKALPKEIIDNLNERYHLDDPLIVQYGNYLYDVFIPHISFTKPEGLSTIQNDFLISAHVGNFWFRWMNFGPSYKSRSRTVNDIFREQLPISAQLGIMALIVAMTWDAAGHPGCFETKHHRRLPGHGCGHLRRIRAGDCSGSNPGLDLWSAH